MTKFNVLTWDFNTDKLKHYNIIPYFIERYKERVERSEDETIKHNIDNYPEHKTRFDVPQTIDEFKKFVEDESMYMFWSKCEWEMIIHGWPVQREKYKIDVHEQIMMNIDVIADILYKELNNIKNDTRKKVTES